MSGRERAVRVAVWVLATILTCGLSPLWLIVRDPDARRVVWMLVKITLRVAAFAMTFGFSEVLAWRFRVMRRPGYRRHRPAPRWL